MKLKKLITIALLGSGLFLGATSAQAQGRGNFDPAQAREQMMARYREVLEVKGDDEWKLISERITKVMEAQREVPRGGGFGLFGRGGRGGQGGNNQAADNNQGRRRGGGGGFGADPSPEQEALQKAVESKASADELKTKMAKFRDFRKDKEAKLAKAQEDLQKVLTVRQEAAALMAGLLK